MKITAGAPLIALLKLAYASNQPVLLVGRHGVGKSQLVEQAARELGIGHIVRDLSLMEPPDLAGLPVIKNGCMSYATPSFLPTDGKGFLVFEELNRAQRYLQAPCLQLLTARKLNDYILPPDWLPIACINPAEGGYHTEEIDAALASRFLRVEVEANVGEWLKWAKGNCVDSRVCEYVSTLREFKSADNNPRAWTYASRLLQTSEKHQAGEETLLAGLTGLVGDEFALGFLKFISGNEKPLDANEVTERYEQTRPTVLRWKENARLDLISGTLHRLQTFLQSEVNWQTVCKTDEHRNNIHQFVRDLPGDLRKQARDFFKQHKYRLDGIAL